MPDAIVLAHTVLIITAAVLFYAAWTDLKEYRIPNELIIVLVGLFLVHAFLSGWWVEMYWNFLMAFVVFLITLPFYLRGSIGGGDVKLMAVALLWVGYRSAVPFTVLLLAIAVVHAVLVKSLAKSIFLDVLGARFRWLNALSLDGRRVPFAPTIAIALIGAFLAGGLDQPPPRYIPKNFPLGNQFPGLKPH